MVKGKVQVKANAKKVTVKANGASVSSPAATSSRIPSKSKSTGSIPSCSKCGILITEEIKALQCDRCQQDSWKCIECLNLSPELYDHLLSDAGTCCNLRWFCDDCDKSVMESANRYDSKGDKIDSLISLVEKLMVKFDNIDDRFKEKCDVSRVVQVESRVKDLEDRLIFHEDGLNQRIMTLEAGVALHEDKLEQLEKDQQPAGDTLAVRRVVEEEVAKSFEELEEEKDVESRKGNIILYRVPEDRTDDLATRNEKDKVYVKDLLDSVFDIRCQQGDIIKMYRLGRWSGDGSAPRPLLVGFSQVDMKSRVMGALRQLKEADQRFKNVSISNDLTPKQREEIKKLLADAKKEHADNSSEDVGNFRFLVVGHGHRKRVIKIRKQI